MDFTVRVKDLLKLLHQLGFLKPFGSEELPKDRTEQLFSSDVGLQDLHDGGAEMQDELQNLQEALQLDGLQSEAGSVLSGAVSDSTGITSGLGGLGGGLGGGGLGGLG